MDVTRHVIDVSESLNRGLSATKITGLETGTVNMSRSDRLGDELFALLDTEPNVRILQTILGHPAHLPSVREFEYMLPATRGEITERLRRLADAHVVTAYAYTGGDSRPREPSTFWGLTEFGADALSERGRFSFSPVLRALQGAVEKPARVEIALEAPRPSLPETVREAFSPENLDARSVDAATDTVLAAWGSS